MIEPSDILIEISNAMDEGIIHGYVAEVRDTYLLFHLNKRVYKITIKEVKK